MSTEELNNKKILLVDDQKPFTLLVEILLNEIGFSRIYIETDFEGAWKSFLEVEPDLCLLDINLGKGQKSGITLAEKIRLSNSQVPIIFITSNYTEEYYAQCRHVRPSCFMNKELSRFKLQHAIELALLNQIPPTPSLAASTKNSVSVPYINNNNLFFKIGDSYKKILVDDISYFFAKDKLTYAKTEGRNFPTNIQLKTLETELSPTFQRIHKTYLVNLNHIEQINTKNDIVKIDNESLPIGYTYKKSFLKHVKLLK